MIVHADQDYELLIRMVNAVLWIISWSRTNALEEQNGPSVLSF
jgi:hypothetical protein